MVLCESVFNAAQQFAVKLVKKKSITSSKSYPEICHKRMCVTNELKALAAINSRRVVKLFSAFQDSANLYFVLEYCAGGDLGGYLSKRGTFSDAELATVIDQIAEGLVFIHLAGFIHRDIKPGNVLIDAMGCLKIADFNVCCGKGDVEHVSWAGTLHYSAPEVFKSTRNFSAKSDIWSLGVIALECCLGRAVFGRNDDDPMSTDIRQVIVNRILNHRVIVLLHLSTISNPHFTSCILHMLCDAEARASAAQILACCKSSGLSNLASPLSCEYFSPSLQELDEPFMEYSPSNDFDFHGFEYIAPTEFIKRACS